MDDKNTVGGFLTTSQAAEIIGRDRTRIVQLINDGSLPAVKAGRDWMIRSEDLEQIKDRSTKPGRPPFISLEDTAERLKVTVKEVQRLIERGDLITKRNAQSVLVVKLKSVEEYLAKTKKKSARKK